MAAPFFVMEARKKRQAETKTASRQSPINRSITISEGHSLLLETLYDQELSEGRSDSDCSWQHRRTLRKGPLFSRGKGETRKQERAGKGRGRNDYGGNEAEVITRRQNNNKRLPPTACDLRLLLTTAFCYAIKQGRKGKKEGHTIEQGAGSLPGP